MQPIAISETNSESITIRL